MILVKIVPQRGPDEDVTEMREIVFGMVSQLYDVCIRCDEMVTIHDVLRSDFLSQYGESMRKMLFCNGEKNTMPHFFLN